MYDRDTIWGLAPSIVRQLHDRARTETALIQRAPRSAHAIHAAAAKYAAGLLTDARSGGYAGVAVVPVHGILSQRGDWFGGATTEDVSATLAELASLPSVSCIVLDFDSPGGATGGVPEPADVVYALRAVKPIIGVVNSLCASAAYGIAAQCSELVCTPSGEVGSAGVYCYHTEAGTNPGPRPFERPREVVLVCRGAKPRESPGRLALIQAALEALDRADLARVTIEREGMTSRSETTGVLHAHPLVKVECEARRQFLTAWKALDLKNDSFVDPRYGSGRSMADKLGVMIG